MAATNPFRVSDLIAKYGWKFIPYAANLGSKLLAEAQVLFVDSGHTNALDADDTEHGHSFEKPLATIDYAIDLCTAAERSVILVAPGHNESLNGTSIDFDVSDITCIGIGEGSNRPTIDFDSTDAQVIIGANNVHLINLRFMPSIDDIAIGVEIEASVTGTILEDCEWAEMEDTGDEFILGLDIKAGCTNTKVTNCLFRTEVTADGATDGIKLTGISDNVIIENCRLLGNWSNAAITNDTGAASDLLIDHCTIKVKDSTAVGITALTTTTGIIRDTIIEATSVAVDSMIVAPDMAWFNNYGVATDGSAAELIGGGEVNAQIVAHGLDHLIGTACADAEDAVDMSAEITDHSIMANILDDGGDAANYDRRAHSLVAIGTDTDAILADTITISGSTLPAAPVSGSLATYISGGSTGLGQPLPASMSLVDLIGNYTGSHDELEADDNIKAHLDLIKTDAETIIEDTGTTLPAELAKIKDQAVGDSVTYFVDSEAANDDGNGLSWATAKQKIQSAVDLVSSYGTIYIRGTGGFTETVTGGTETGVKIIGVGDGKINPLWTSEAVGESALTINGQNWEVRNILFHAGGETKTVAMIRVCEDGSNKGSGSVIENCYFHGGGTSDQAVCYYGGSIQNKLLNNHITSFGGTCTGDEAAVCGGSYVQSWCDGEVRGNVFDNNTKHLRLQAGNSLFKDNVFESQGEATSATTIINLVSSGESVGYNTVVGNTFGDISQNLNEGNGYYFSTTDLVAGNHCPDGPSEGKPNGIGNVLYVDSDNGKDTYDGSSWGRAKLTIQAAVTAAVDYTTIYIRGVTVFEEDVVTPTATTNVKLIGVDDTKRRPDWRSTAADTYALQIRSLDWEVHNIRFSGNNTNTVCLVKVTYAGAYTGAGVLIKDCYFHGGGDSVGGIEFNGGGFQNDVIGCHFTDFGGAGAAGIWTTNHLNYFLHAKIIGNWFSENVNNLRINAQTCLVKDNVFQAEGAERDATIVCDLVNGGGAGTNGNCCVGNYFGNAITDITNANGYYGTTGDMWAGNYCTDGIDTGGAPVA